MMKVIRMAKMARMDWLARKAKFAKKKQNSHYS